MLERVINKVKNEDKKVEPEIPRLAKSLTD